jgi:hypothetical protein
MNKPSKLTKLALLGATWGAVALTASSSANAQSYFAAQEDNPNGVYLGAGWGQFNLDLEGLDDVGSGLRDVADSDDNAWKLFAGYRFNPYFALEGAYIDFGTHDDRFDTSGSDGNYRVQLSGFAPYVMGTVPLGPVELFARLGYLFYDNDVRIDFDSPGPDIDSSHSGSDLLYGGGVGVTILERLNLRAEYEVVDLEDASNSDAMWLAAAWRF